MMETTSSLEQLVTALSRPQLSADIICQLTSLIEQQNAMSVSSFVSQSFQSLLTLEQWAWQLLSQDYLEWINLPFYTELFYILASFNKMLIYTNDIIEEDSKAALLFSETTDQLNRIFKHIEQCDDDNNPYITIVNLWFDNHSYFLGNTIQYNTLYVVDYIAEYFARNCMMDKQFKFYLSQLRQPQITQSIFTAKMLFYIKTCLFYLYTYLELKSYNFYYTADEIIHYLGDDYLQIMNLHSHTVETWSEELLGCIAHLISFVSRCCWWGGHRMTQMKILCPTEQISYGCIRNIMCIIAHEPFYEKIKTQRSNDETALLEASLFFLMNMVETFNINWLFRSNTSYQKIFLAVAETSINEMICTSAYHIMGIVLTNEQMKEFKITDVATSFCFKALEQAWYHPSKMYKDLSVVYILQSIRNLSKNDSMQQKIADLNKIPLFIEMSDQHPIIYDILWALSFNQDIQQQLRSSSTFMSKLAHLAKDCDNEQMRKIIHGILWNLEIHHDDRLTLETNETKTFDIMISYSHKDKTFCQQLYEELTKVGYHVWIDFDQMHGNVMDAMAQAIERSDTVIICMSEDYRKSNYCRAEAHYAFQRQRKIVPIVLQKRYKPDGWLLFLIGQLIYVDFIKHEFDRAMQMLLKELKAAGIAEPNQLLSCRKEVSDTVAPVRLASTPRASPSLVLSQNILEWTSTDVQAWLTNHDLEQMVCLLKNCNGRSLVYLNKYMKIGESQQILKLLQADSLRRTGQDLSLIELSCFRSLMDEQNRLAASSVSTKTKMNSVQKNS